MSARAGRDITGIILLSLVLWQFFTSGDAVNTMLYPQLREIVAIFATDWRKMLLGIGSSMYLLGTGMGLALILGIVLGLLTGGSTRLSEALLPLAKVISPVPPIIYTPYAVAVLPSFEIASIFVIFSSIFWQIYIQVATAVRGIDPKLLDSARTLNLNAWSMLWHVLWPYCLPRIMKALPVAVANAFMVLTAAEMIGAQSGLGYYVRYYADFADYTRVIAGILLIGIVVSLLNGGIAILERRLVRWH